MLLLLLLLILIPLLYIYLRKQVGFWDAKGVKTKKPHLIFGHLYDTFTKKLSISDVILNHYNEFKNRRYYGMYLLHKPFFLVKDPELIKQITVKKSDHFIDHVNGGHPEVDLLWSKTIFSLLGDEWGTMRSILSPAFTGSKMRLMFPLLDECAESFVNFIYEKKEDLVELEMRDVISRVTNDMIASTSFGIKCDSLREPNNEFYVIGRKALTFDGLRRFNFFLYGVYPKILQLFGGKIFNKDISTFFRRLIKDTIKQREELGIVRPDMIHLLLECRKGLIEQEDGAEKSLESEDALKLEAKKKRAMNITDEDITAQALIFFFGGMDTTSFLMGFVAYELALNPDIQEKLRAEVLDAFEKCNGKLTYAALMELNYLDMVISESLRKYPIGFVIDRLCTKDYVIEPESADERRVVLKKGSMVWIPVLGLHRDERYYPNPERFDPERFSKENKSNIKPFTYMPFGSGPRNCIGSRLALLKVKSMIAHLLRRMEIVPVNRTKIPLELCKNNSLMVCAGGLWLGFKKR